MNPTRAVDYAIQPYLCTDVVAFVMALVGIQ